MIQKSKTDKQLFEELHEWLKSEGFVISDVERPDELPENSLTPKWQVVHPKAPKVTECFIYEEIFEQHRKVSGTPKPLQVVISVFKWMIDFYEINA